MTAYTRSPELLASYYNAEMASRNFHLPPHLMAPCMALMDQRIRKLLIIVGPGAGKSQLISVIYPAVELGLDPTTTILGVSAGEALMQGFQASVAQIIEWSDVYHTFFPDTKPNKDLGWSTANGIFVTGHSPSDPDASYFTAGLSSKALTGKHGRILLFDDLHDRENSASLESCNKVVTTYYDTLLGRADPQGARFVIAGRRWNQNDLYSHLQKEGDFVTMTLPAERKGTKLYWDVTVPDGLECCFTDKLAA